MVMFSPWLLVLIVVIAIWDLIWKGIALWRSGRNNHLGWFVVILIVNTVGILPLVYLIWFDKSKKTEKKTIQKKVVKKKR
jgi:hypothetical protein